MSDELRYKVLRSGCEVPSSPGTLSSNLAKLILAAVCDHADRSGIMFVGYRTLAAELDLNHNTTLAAYKLFETHGIMVRTGQRRGTGGATVYRVCLDGLTPTNPKYYLPSALSTQAASVSVSDSGSALRTDPGTDPGSCPASALTAQARSVSMSVSTSSSCEALFRQALELEIEYRPSRKYSFDQLADMKRDSYLPVCRSVLAEFPEASPTTNPDRELALLVASKLNPTLPALQITDASKRELIRRYKRQPEPTEKPLTLEQIHELKKRKPFGQP